MKTGNIKQLVSEAVKDHRLIPVRAYYKGETYQNLKVKMPLVNEGHKFHQHAELPKGLVWYTFNDHERKEETMPNEYLFMLVPLMLWRLHFNYQPGSTWTCPQHFKVDTGFHGDR